MILNATDIDKDQQQLHYKSYFSYYRNFRGISHNSLSFLRFREFNFPDLITPRITNRIIMYELNY